MKLPAIQRRFQQAHSIEWKQITGRQLQCARGARQRPAIPLETWKTVAAFDNDRGSFALQIDHFELLCSSPFGVFSSYGQGYDHRTTNRGSEDDQVEVATMDSARKIRVFVVDDHPLMVAGIAGEINSQPDMTVVAQATDGEEALATYRLHRPDVTLMDVRMPKGNGIDAIVSIRNEFPKARIIVLTTAIGDVQAVRAFREGAVGYLLKNLVRKELTETIRAVHSGLRRIPAEVAQQMAEYAAGDDLSARELDVLRRVAQGKANKAIACDLEISEHTVKNHMKSILSKLGVDDRTGAVVIAARRGYIEI